MTHQETLFTPFFESCPPSLSSHLFFPDFFFSDKLFIPKNSRAFLQTLHFFSGSVKKVCFLLFKLKSNLINPHFLKESLLGKEVRRTFGPKKGIALKKGTPGPFSKDTMLFLGPNCLPHSIVKLGRTPAAKNLLLNEKKILEKLQSFLSIKQNVPICPNFFETERIFGIEQTINYNFPFSKPRVSFGHVDFLKRLGQESRKTMRFCQTQMWAKMELAFQELAPRLPMSVFQTLHQYLSTLFKGLNQADSSFVLSHKDFVWWNIRQSNNSIWVFDWEFSHDEVLPLYDLFHFSLMPQAVNRNFEPITTLKKLACNFQDPLVKGGFKKELRHLSFQLLGYLLDVALFFLSSHGKYIENDIVVKNYLSLIEQFGDFPRYGFT